MGSSIIQRNAHELGTFNSRGGRNFLNLHDSEDEGMSKREYQDREQLARLGKISVLKRNFSFMTILGFSCTCLITWEGSLILFAQGLNNGGPAGLIYGFLVVWLGNVAVFSTLSELASMAPTSGGQYHWVSMLAPRSSAKFLSYITGWLAVSGWQGAVASGGYLTGTMIQGLIRLCNESYEPQPYQATLLFWATIAFCVLINAGVSSLLPKFEAVILVLHIFGFFGILIPLVVLGPHAEAKDVFTTFVNGGEWPTQGLSFFVGLIGNVFAFAGADAAFHMAEEVPDPSIVVPQSVMFTMLVNGSCGFAMLIAVLFCMGDVEKAMHTPTGYPLMEIFQQATKSVIGAAVMSSIIAIMGICATVGLFASTSRVTWSFARDRGLPFWRTISKVHPVTSVPLQAIGLTSIIACLLALIVLGSSAAFNAIVSLSISGLYSSYLIAAALLLYRRCTSGFSLPLPDEHLPALANTAGAELVWGPFHIPGVWGIVNNAFACVYLFTIWFFSFWPQTSHVDAKSMNFSPLMTGTVFLFSVGYYLVWGRRDYKGPIVETL